MVIAHYVVLQCLLHLPQLLPKLQAFGVLSAVADAISTWCMCGKNCNPSDDPDCGAGSEPFKQVADKVHIPCCVAYLL